jgi:two-component system OmpR family response regulator
MERHLALVEDDDVIRANYTDLLTQAGFHVDAYPTKSAALAALVGDNLPDVVLLDITMGGERDAGFDICAELRRRSPRLPIIFLTSHDGEVDKISGLRLGADDYLTKDVSIDYLIVRIEALFRRLAALGAVPPASTVAATLPSSSGQPLEVNEEMSTVTWKGQRLDLPLTQFWMLRELVRHPGKVLSHSDLMKAARIVVEPNTVTAHVKAIRDTFRRADADFDGIRTERGRGYRWLAA